jgi:hypothetical protein
MALDRRPSPDGDPRPTGASDSYLSTLAPKGSAAGHGPSVAPDNSGGWSDAGSRYSFAGCCDPYLAESGRSARGDF